MLNPMDTKAQELKIDKEKLMKRLVGHVELLDRRSAALENLIETTDVSNSRTKAVITRHRNLRDKHSNAGTNKS